MADLALPDDGRIRIDTDAHRVWRGARELHMPLRRYQLLVALHGRAGRVVTHAQLAQDIWGNTWACQSAVRMQMVHLRRDLGDAPDGSRYVTSVRSVGYRLEARWAAPLDAGDTVTVRRDDLDKALAYLELAHAALGEDNGGEYNPAYRTRLRAALEEAAHA